MKYIHIIINTDKNIFSEDELNLQCNGENIFFYYTRMPFLNIKEGIYNTGKLNFLNYN